MLIEAHIPLGKTFDFQRIMDTAVALHREGLSYRMIAELLGVTDKTAKKAVMFADACRR